MKCVDAFCIQTFQPLVSLLTPTHKVTRSIRGPRCVLIVPQKIAAAYTPSMRKYQAALIVVTVSVLVSGCGASNTLTSNAEKAQKYILEACGDTNATGFKLSWQARTNLAAEAYSLDKSWEKFYDATSSLASVDEIAKKPSNWVNADGNDGLQMNYINAKMYSIYVAECTKLLENE